MLFSGKTQLYALFIRTKTVKKNLLVGVPSCLHLHTPKSASGLSTRVHSTVDLRCSVKRAEGCEKGSVKACVSCVSFTSVVSFDCSGGGKICPIMLFWPKVEIMRKIMLFLKIRIICEKLCEHIWDRAKRYLFNHRFAH